MRSHHPHSIREEEEDEQDEMEEDVLPQMEASKGIVDERLRALLMLLNQVCTKNTYD